MILEDLILKMPILESDLFSKAIPGYQNQEDDNSQLQRANLRKTRLSLLQINKLRNMHDIRKLEQQKSIQVIQQQYGPSDEGSEF